MPDTWDPFTAVHQAIFAAFENYAPLAAVVLPGNFIDTTDAYFEQFKPDATAGDTPQLKILQSDFTLPPFGGNSTTVQLTQTYRVMICTDVLRVAPLNQVKYLALIALVQAGPNLGLSCVSGYQLGPGRDDTQSPDTKSPNTDKSQRWAAAFNITVQIYLSRRQLAAS